MRHFYITLRLGFFLLLSAPWVRLFAESLFRTASFGWSDVLTLAVLLALTWGLAWGASALIGGLSSALAGLTRQLGDPRTVPLMFSGLLVCLVGMALGALWLEGLGLALSLLGLGLSWPHLRRTHRADRSTRRWTRTLRPPRKLEVSHWGYAPSAHDLSSTLERLPAPRLELSLEGGQVWLENHDASSVLVKGLSSSEVNGWWMPLHQGRRKPVLNTLEKAEADLWVQDHDTVRVRVWCCRLESPAEEFVLERELGAGIGAVSRTLN